MTEKKYMTASEYFRNEIPLRVKIYMNEFNKSKLVLEELDAHFINKEELKEKIRKIESELQHTLDEEQDSFIIATTTKSYFYVHMLFKKLLEEDK